MRYVLQGNILLIPYSGYAAESMSFVIAIANMVELAANARKCAKYRMDILLDSKVQTVACCAGSGSTVLRDCSADVLLTGEMSHHDVLHATSTGRTAILCEHSNTERGFLLLLKNRLIPLLDNVAINVSAVDKDPLVIM